MKNFGLWSSLFLLALAFFESCPALVYSIPSKEDLKGDAMAGRWVVVSFLLALLGLAQACGGSKAFEPKLLPSAPACARVELNAQSRERWAIGTPFYLPHLRSSQDQVTDSDATSCEPLEWELVARPQSSAVALGLLMRDAGGISRLVPDAPGVYSVRLVAPQSVSASDEFQVTVMPQADIPFHNYNYTPSTALTFAEGLIWAVDPINGQVYGVDPASGEVARQVVVGGWPVAVAAVPAQGTQPSRLFVLQKASDSIAVVDPLAGRLLDANFVGDEPSEIVASPDGKTAYVSLASDGVVAVVNLADLSVAARIDAVRDPRYMALSADGSRLFVASFRSGSSVRYPYPDAAPETQKDLVLINTSSKESVQSWGDVGTTLQGLLLGSDGSLLYMSRLINDTRLPLAAPGNQSFRYEIAALDAVSGEVKQSRGFQARAEVEGDSPLVAPVSMALESDGGAMWVVFEGSDTVVRLALPSLTETHRFVTPGRPRSVFIAEGKVWIHGHQSFQLTSIDLADKTLRTMQLTEADARGELLALGQSYFTAAGQSYAKGWSCNSCHVEGVTDNMVWNAGPVRDTHVSKPFFWLEGTAPLGWQGYMSSVRNYSYEVHSNIGIRATNDKVAALQTYMRSLTVPPAANSLTERDGALSPEALAGQVIFNGKGGCAGCHAMPLGTNNRTYDPSSTEDKADVPSIVGTYRQGVWLKHGEASTLGAAIDNMVAFAGAQLTDVEKLSLQRYLQELTGRDFFLLSATPESQKMVGSAVADNEVPVDVASSFELVFSLPILATSDNLQRIRIVDAAGQAVATTVEVVSPRMVRVAPEAGTALQPGSRYLVAMDPDLESYSGAALIGRREVSLVTAKAPQVRFEGNYTLRFFVPRLVVSPDGNRFDTDATGPVDVSLVAAPTASGADVTLDLKAGLTFPVRAVVSGTDLYIPPTPIPAGPISFVDAFSGFWSTFADDNSDGIGDRASGRFVFSGPGFAIPNMKWELIRNP